MHRSIKKQYILPIGTRRARLLSINPFPAAISSPTSQPLPFLYPMPLEDFGQFVEAPQTFGNIIILGGVINPHLGLSISQRRLDRIKRSRGRQRIKYKTSALNDITT